MNEMLTPTGRQCDGCTMCCKLLAVKDLDKPRAVWCEHCAIGKGCTIYEARPEACRNYYCAYMTRATIAEHWRPEHSGMVIVWGLERGRVSIHVDPERPNVWREEPYRSDIDLWMAIWPPDVLQIVIYFGLNVRALLPDREIDLGMLPEEDWIVTEMVPSPNGFRPEVYTMKPDDPRALEIERQRARA